MGRDSSSPEAFKGQVHLPPAQELLHRAGALVGSGELCCGAMEGNAHLLQVIRKMRSQINKLERENKALRGELQVCGQRAVPPEGEAARRGGIGNARSLDSGGEGAAGSPASLLGSVMASRPLAPKEQTGTAEPGLSMARTCAAQAGS